MAKRNDALETLKRRWLRKRGEAMPDEILRLPFDRILRAVTLIEAGNDVVVPSCPVSTPENRDGFGHGDSMREWDGDSFG